MLSPRSAYRQRPLIDSPTYRAGKQEDPIASSVTQFRDVLDPTDYYLGAMGSGKISFTNVSGRTDNILKPLACENSVTSVSGHTEEGLDPMSMTQSAKTMLDMLDEMSLSEGILSDVSFGMFEQDGSNR